MPPLRVELRPSSSYGWLLAVAWLAGVAAALASHHPLLLKGSVLLGVTGLLLQAWRDEVRHGVRVIEIAGDGVVRIGHADGRERRGAFAGHAGLGAYAVFLFVTRDGWPGLAGPARITVPRDATDPDSFRRLRARLRLAPPFPAPTAGVTAATVPSRLPRAAGPGSPA